MWKWIASTLAPFREPGQSPTWKDFSQVAAWPAVAALLTTILWGVTLSELAHEREWARTAAFKQATSLANSYAGQLRHTVELIDQIVLNLKYEWEDPDVKVNIEKKRALGLFPESAFLYLFVVNRRGEIATSSIISKDRHPNVGELPFFQSHKADCCIGLLITGQDVGLLGRPVIRFSRRLNKPDGSFDGVAMVAVEPSYLTSFQDEELLGKNDFISARLTTGPLLAQKRGKGASQIPKFAWSDPLFSTESGVALESGEKYTDSLPRIVAWTKLQRDPLVAVATLSEQDVFAAYKISALSRREMAAMGSLLLVSFAGVGMYFSARLAWRRRREEEVRLTYRLATDAANEGFYMIRPLYRDDSIADFQLEDCNDSGAALVGMEREALIGSKASQLMPDELREEIFFLCRRALETGLYEDELRVSPPSPLKATWIYRRMVRSGASLALTMRDISEGKEHEQALSNLANNDALTKLPNRNWLTDFLPTAVKRAVKRNGHLALLFIDLDNFKNINDTLGHDAGDELLKQAALRLKGSVRASDHVVRLGGDEFTAILEQIDLIDDVSRVARAIVKTFSEPFTLFSGTANQVTASIGISMFPQDGEDCETLLKHADIAMYAAKAAGKGCYHFYHADLLDTLILRLGKARALRLAVEHDEFVVYYQPRVEAKTGRLTSMEALVRWTHPERGLVYPAEFIDLAEGDGLIVRIGELVIEKVCAQLNQWKAQGLPLVPVSINISPQQLKCGSVSSFLGSCIARHGIEPRLIEAELTESAVIDRSQVVSNELAELRLLGIKLIIDDFGTGYSSLAQLHRLDVDMLKVDQTFTEALCKDAEGKVFFQAIVSMAAALDMCVVAEGVETSEQVDILQSLSCDEIQGYFISKAVAAVEVPRLMIQRFLFPSSGLLGRIAPV